MVETNVRCIHCNSKEVVKTGKQSNGTPRCKCKECGKTICYSKSLEMHVILFALLINVLEFGLQLF